MDGMRSRRLNGSMRSSSHGLRPRSASVRNTQKSLTAKRLTQKRTTGRTRPLTAGSRGGSVAPHRPKLHGYENERRHFQKCAHSSKRGPCIAQVQGDALFCKNHAPAEWCTRTGCGAMAEGHGGLCERHKPRPLCAHQGCGKPVSAVHNKLCKLHAGPRKCTHRNCDFDAVSESGRCEAHPLGCTQVNPNRMMQVDFCWHAGCNNAPQQDSDLCAAHAARPVRPLDWEPIHHPEDPHSLRGRDCLSLGEGGAESKAENKQIYCRGNGCRNPVPTKGAYCKKHAARRVDPLSWSRMHNEAPDEAGGRRQVKPEKEVCDERRWCSHRRCDQPAAYSDGVVLHHGKQEVRWLCAIHATHADQGVSPVRCSHLNVHGMRCTHRADRRRGASAIDAPLCQKHAPIEKENKPRAPGLEYYDVMRYNNGSRRSAPLDGLGWCSLPNCDRHAIAGTILCCDHTLSQPPNIRRGHNVEIKMLYDIMRRRERKEAGEKNVQRNAASNPLVMGPHHGSKFDKEERFRKKKSKEDA